MTRRRDAISSPWQLPEGFPRPSPGVRHGQCVEIRSCEAVAQDDALASQNDDDAAVFAVPNFKQESKWLDRTSLDAISTIFFHHPNCAGALPSDSYGNFLPLKAELDGFFTVPWGAGAAAEGSIVTGSDPDDGSLVDDASGVDNDCDMWIDHAQPAPTAGNFLTWTALGADKVTIRQPMLVSEAGPAVFDALLSDKTDCSDLGNVGVPIVETHAYVSSLEALAAGRDSMFFAHVDDCVGFKPALPKVRLSGYSWQALEGLQDLSTVCGTSVKRLQSFVEHAYNATFGRCGLALASGVKQILEAVTQHLTIEARNPRSLLQLQVHIRRVTTILLPLVELVNQLHDTPTDAEVLSRLFSSACTLDDGFSPAQELLRALFDRSSEPWMDFVEEWIGTKPELTPLFTKMSIGNAKGFVRIKMEVSIDDFGREVEDVDFHLDSGQVPDFMPLDLMDDVFETGHNLRFIRSYHPSHTILQQATIESCQPPKLKWAYDWDTILDVEKRVMQYRDSLCQALQKMQTPSLSISDSGGMTCHRDVSTLKESCINSVLWPPVERLNSALPDHISQNQLGRLVRKHLSNAATATERLPAAVPHGTLLPLLSLGGLVTTQSRIINRESLRLLFDNHNIRAHLRLQRDFHLFGSGTFCSRLSDALFSPEGRSVRDIGQGGMFGLRLGRRDTWPPATSELRLALMGVLTDSYQRATRKASNDVVDLSELPGNLSFAVRTLTQEEAERCMDPSSLEALDFLRLSYSTPPELSSFLTPINLMHYDRIFKLLLRVLRLLHVTGHLWSEACLRNGALLDTPRRLYCRFAREAQHFVASVASYIMDVGIAPAWSVLESRLDGVQAALGRTQRCTTDVGAASPGFIRELHSQVLDRILFALFLRKRQEPVLALLEEVFSAILKFAHEKWALDLRPEREEEKEEEELLEMYTNLSRRIGKFITACRELSEKARHGGGAIVEEVGVGEQSLVAQLLLKLDAGNFHSQ